MCKYKGTTYVTTFQEQLSNELAAGPDGPPISESKLVYLRTRSRARFFDFLIERFERAHESGLNQAKLARRIRKTPDIISRWLAAPGNLTLDSITDLIAGIGAEEMNFSASSLLNRHAVNRSHLDDAPPAPIKPTEQRHEGASAAGPQPEYGASAAA
jgi:hypothetical protein